MSRLGSLLLGSLFFVALPISQPLTAHADLVYAETQVVDGTSDGAVDFEGMVGATLEIGFTSSAATYDDSLGFAALFADGPVTPMDLKNA